MRWKALTEHKNPIYEIHYRDNAERDVYFYVQVPELKVPLLEKALAGNAPFDLAYYGKIITKGLGQPNARTRKLALTKTPNK